MKVDLTNNTQYEYDKSIYTNATKKEKKAMNQANKYFGNAKLKMKNELSKNVSKDIKNMRYSLKTSRLKKISESLFDEINNINTDLYLEVSQELYETTMKKYKEDVTKTFLKENKPTSKLIETWLTEFIMGAGINYIYNQEVDRHCEYFNSQMTNAIMNDVNTKIISELSKDDTDIKTKSDLEKYIKSILSMNTKNILNEIKKHKKMWGQVTDDTMAVILNKTLLESYSQLGIDKVVRVAVIDDRTCDDCKELNGTVYEVDNVPQLLIHRNDRCMYLPYIENANK